MNWNQAYSNCGYNQTVRAYYNKYDDVTNATNILSRYDN